MRRQHYTAQDKLPIFKNPKVLPMCFALIILVVRVSCIAGAFCSSYRSTSTTTLPFFSPSSTIVSSPRILPVVSMQDFFFIEGEDYESEPPVEEKQITKDSLVEDENVEHQDLPEAGFFQNVLGPFFAPHIKYGVPASTIQGVVVPFAGLALLNGASVTVAASVGAVAAYVTIHPGIGGDAARKFGELACQTGQVCIDANRKYKVGSTFSKVVTTTLKSSNGGAQSSNIIDKKITERDIEIEKVVMEAEEVIKMVDDILKENEDGAKRKAEEDQKEAEEIEKERLAAEKAEAERIAAEKAETERIVAEKSEAERIAVEKSEAERIAAEKAEAERIVAEKSEAERIAAEKSEAEQIAAEKAEAEQIAAEKSEAERISGEEAIAEVAGQTVIQQEAPSQNEYKNMTVAQLKDVLRSKKLKVSGKKAELIERLSEQSQ